MCKRKFYSTKITVEVLSEAPFEFEDLSDVHHAITEGECSGAWVAVFTVLNGKQTAERLVAQGSDPAFFQLTQEGKNV